MCESVDPDEPCGPPGESHVADSWSALGRGFSRRSLLLAAPVAAGVAVSMPAGTAHARAVPLRIYRGNRSRREVALSFDAGADRGNAEGILDLLGEHGITASFGMTGPWVRRNPDLAQRVANEGHHLINHSMTHRSFVRGGPGGRALTGRERFWELDQADAVYQEIMGVSSKPWFRPPFLALTWRGAQDCADRGYDHIAMCTRDSLGWKRIPKQYVIERCVGVAANGASMMFHVGKASTDFRALPGVIAGIAGRGFRMVSVKDIVRVE